MAPRLAPMLAGSGTPTDGLGGWVAEPKFDGWRAVVSVDDGLEVGTRTGRVITESVPELTDLAASGLRVVLDGELVSAAGRMTDFYRLAPTLAARKRRPGGVTFVAFDLLWCDGVSVVDCSYRQRRALLERLAELVTIAPSFAGEDADDLLDACQHHDVEGLVLKRLNSVYRPGQRSTDWRKVKCETWRQVHSERRRPER